MRQKACRSASFQQCVRVIQIGLFVDFFSFRSPELILFSCGIGELMLLHDPAQLGSGLSERTGLGQGSGGGNASLS